MVYQMCFNISTFNCSISIIEEKLKHFTADCYKLSENILLFATYKDKTAFSFVSVPEYVINILFDNYINDDGVLIITPLNDSCYYNLPDEAIEFINHADTLYQDD
ncbi:MAG: hypothetical protein HFE63_10870 [Clostridiales bacterium]|nr:hypothetical protein [Clostridiales bacterium]